MRGDAEPAGAAARPHVGVASRARVAVHLRVGRARVDQGDVAPTRVIKGSKTGLKNPTGVSVDLKNKEVWASNLGNSSATVYSLTANGDARPIRTIRSAPKGKVSLRFGKTQAVAYDSKREQILVPN